MNVVDIALAHAQARDSSAFLFAFAAGAATSIGPCVAPRYVAVTVLAGSMNGAAFRRLLAFVAGTITVYLAIASAGSLLMRLAQASSTIYWVLALALVISGMIALWRGGTHSCSPIGGSATTLGGSFLLGAATSTTMSPCCTPILITLGALTTATAGSGSIIALVSIYTIGHVAPLMMLFLMTRAAKSIVVAHRDAAGTVSAAVTIALGLYYAVLA